MTVTIYGFAASTWTRTARMACVEKGVAHRLEPLDYGSDAHAELHPFLRMPAARIGDVLLYETLAIVSYLDAVTDGPRLTPADPHERARMLGWVTAAGDYLYPDLVRAALGDDGPVPDAATTANSRLRIVDRALADRETLAGAHLSIADLAVCPMVAFAAEYLGTAATDGLDALATWMDRMRARDSFVATAPALAPA